MVAWKYVYILFVHIHTIDRDYCLTLTQRRRSRLLSFDVQAVRTQAS